MGSRVRTGYEAVWLTPPVLNHPAHNICRFPIAPVDNRNNQVLVFVNGAPVGTTTTPWQTMIELKRSCTHNFRALLPFDVSVTWIGGPLYRGGPLKSPYFNFISVNGDDGAYLRPVLVTSQVHKLEHLVACHLHSPSDLHDAMVHEGVMVYLDAEQEDNSALVCESMTELKAKEPWRFELDVKKRKQGLANYHVHLPHCPTDNISDQIKMTESIPLLGRHEPLDGPIIPMLRYPPILSMGFWPQRHRIIIITMAHVIHLAVT